MLINAGLRDPGLHSRADVRTLAPKSAHRKKPLHEPWENRHDRPFPP
jgi:hypothetical protein